MAANETSTVFSELVIAKVSVLFLMGVVSFISGIAPYYIFSNNRCLFLKPKLKQINSLIACFSGGTILGIAFLHILPEVTASLDTIYEIPQLSYIIFMAGFLGVYVVDEVMHFIVGWLYSRMHKKSGKEGVEGVEAKIHGVAGHAGNTNNSKDQCHQEPLMHHHSITQGERVRKHTSNDICKWDIGEGSSPCRVEDDRQEGQTQPLSCGECPDHHSVILRCNRILPQLSVVLTIIALSFHDIFEGIAVGVDTHLNSILFLFLSIATHKFTITFCIGTEFALSGSTFKMLLWSMFAFSIVSPVGVIIGMISFQSSQSAMGTAVPAILQALAGGTLLYIVCFEILQSEGSHNRGVKNVFSVIMGFLVTVGFIVLFGEHHHHHHSHGAP